MKKIILIISMFFIGNFSSVYAQTKIMGIIKDNQGQPLYGVTVKVKGTAKAVITDFDGKYSIEASSNDVLLVSFIGMATQEIEVNGRSVVDVNMGEDSQQLEEAVVVAYGTAKKTTMTGSVASVDEKRLQEAQVSNVSNALQGTNAGVQVVTTSGQPGQGATIRIRGVGSLTGSNNPLIVVDGVPYDGALSSINPSDIKSMTVLKDAASASIYGSRAANGVIVITSNLGAEEKDPEITVRSTAGLSFRSVDPIKRVNTNRWMELQWEAVRNGHMDNGVSGDKAVEMASTELISSWAGINPYGSKYPEPVGHDGKLISGLNPLWEANWDDEIIGVGERYETNVNIRGGSKKTRYYLSAGYLNDKGMMLRSSFERISTRLNIKNKTTEWLTSDLNINYTHSKTQFNDGNDDVNNGVNYGLGMVPFYPIYERNPDSGELILDENGNKRYDYGNYRKPNTRTGNLIDYLKNHSIDDTENDLVSLRASMTVDFSKISEKLDFLKGLKFKSSYNTDINHGKGYYYYPSYLAIKGTASGYHQDLVNTSAGRALGLTRGYTFNNVLSFDKKIDGHEINLLFGQEIYQYHYTYSGGSKKSFPMEGVYEPNFGAVNGNFSSYTDLYRLSSLFGRAEYNFEEKYSASFSIRRDGTSRFHPDNRWGTFWSIGGSWNIHKEEFMTSSILNDYINMLKLRASYGGSGNQKVGTYYAYQNLYSTSRVGDNPSVAIARLGNPNLVWEGNITTNIGLDFALLHGRIRGSVEWFQRESNDLIYSLPLPYSSGFTSILDNVGAMRNRGFEFSLEGTIVKTDNFKWDMGFNATTFSNEITEFPQDEVISGNKRLKEGSDIYAFYVREWSGMSKVNEKLYLPSQDSETGITTVDPNNVRVSKGGEATWWVKDEVTGKRYKTNDYTLAHRVDAGSALPDLYGGINTSIKIYDFSISALMSYKLGGQLYTTIGYHNLGTVGGSNFAESMNGRWTPKNQNSDLPRLTTQRPAQGWHNTSTRHLYDASYARLKNLTLTYNVPRIILNKIGFNSASIFVQGENLLTLFSGPEGIDPEMAGLSGGFSGGTNYPIPRTVSAGINLSF